MRRGCSKGETRVWQQRWRPTQRAHHTATMVGRVRRRPEEASEFPFPGADCCAFLLPGRPWLVLLVCIATGSRLAAPPGVSRHLPGAPGTSWGPSTHRVPPSAPRGPRGPSEYLGLLVVPRAFPGVCRVSLGPPPPLRPLRTLSGRCSLPGCGEQPPGRRRRGRDGGAPYLPRPLRQEAGRVLAKITMRHAGHQGREPTGRRTRCSALEPVGTPRGRGVLYYYAART